MAHYVFDLTVARRLGLESFGNYAIMISYTFILTSIATMGFPELANRRVSDLRREQDWEGVARFALLGIIVLVVTGTLSSFLLLGAVGLDILSVSSSALTAGFLLVPVLAIFNFLRQFALVSGHTRTGLFAPSVALAAATLAILLPWLAGSSAFIPLFVLSASYLAGAIALGGLSIPRLHVRSMSSSLTETWKDWTGSSGPVVLSNIATVITSHLDLVLIANFTGPLNVGIYAAASRLSQALTLPLAGVSLRDAPRFGKLLAESKHKACWDVYVDSMRASTLLAATIGLALISTGPFLMDLFTRGQSDNGWVWLLILIVGRGASAATGPVALLLIALRRSKHAAGGAVLGLVVSILGIVTLGTLMGPVGVAIAKALGLVVQNGIQFVLAKRTLSDLIARTEERTRNG